MATPRRLRGFREAQLSAVVSPQPEAAGGSHAPPLCPVSSPGSVLSRPRPFALVTPWPESLRSSRCLGVHKLVFTTYPGDEPLFAFTRQRLRTTKGHDVVSPLLLALDLGSPAASFGPGLPGSSLPRLAYLPVVPSWALLPPSPTNERRTPSVGSWGERPPESTIPPHFLPFQIK